MALSRQIFTAANTEEFAEALRTALDNTGLFDSVTRSTIVVTATKDEQDILTVNLGVTESTIVTHNKGGSQLSDVWILNGSLASYASIITDGTFVYCIFTNDATIHQDAVHAITMGVFGTDKEEVGFVFSLCRNTTRTTYPPTETNLSSSTAVAVDLGTAFILPKSYTWGGIESYPITTLTTDGGMDVLKGVCGVIAAPQLFTLARTAAGVTPPEITLNGKQYLTDGVLLIEING